MPHVVATFGEIMLRLSPPGHQRVMQAHSFEATFGGAEANVAGALAGFGELSRYITRLPDNDLALACLMYLRAQGIDTSSILIGGQRLGVYFVEQGSAHRPGQVIYDRADSAFATLEAGIIDWSRALQGADWFHWTGISPAVSENAYRTTREALEAARAQGITISCDLNYRSKLWQWGRSAHDVMTELLPFCDVFIGSAWQVSEILGISPVDTGPRLHDVWRRLHTITLTRRGDGGSWTADLWRSDRLFAGREYQVGGSIDPVGSGDAFAAGLIYGLRHFGDPQRTLDFALAAGVFKHSVPGDALMARVRDIEGMLSDRPSEHIRR